MAKNFHLLQLALMQRWVMLYLVAQVLGEDGIKLFAMQRIKAVEYSECHQSRPKQFTLH
ncbi:hypothetical protein N5C36_21295 [Shewanella xiamenensis]|uniref:hypothetical protein n=1 Tax=Shewanella xiamenensis TaxID=332186 RepID=UPI001C4DF890|nr:hypothetical protein [Shewanella xiamenensis]MDH1316615.1 hypothetical protein [Shewanella xiamenensis]